MKTKQSFVGEKWKLRSGLLYAGIGSMAEARLVGPDDALVFDSRDNEVLKLRFYEMLLGVRFVIEVCAS